MLNNLELCVAIWVVIWCASVDYRQSNNNIWSHLRRFILCGVLFVRILFRSHLFDFWREKTEPNYIMSLWSDVYFRIAIDVSSRILSLSLSLSLFRFVGWNGRYAYICKQTLSSSFNLICRTIECAFKFEQREREWENST